MKQLENNGRPNFYKGSEIINKVAPGSNRRVVIREGNNFKPVEAGKHYELDQLLGKTGKPLMVNVPQRTKG